MQQPLNGFQQVGHAIVPGDVLEYTDMVHESLGRTREGRGLLSILCSWGLQRNGWGGLARGQLSRCQGTHS